MQASFEQRMSQLTDVVVKKLEEGAARAMGSGAGDVAGQSAVEGSGERTMNRAGYQTWTFGGRFVRVPPWFEVPRVSCSQFAITWYFGVPQHRISPLRLVDGRDFKKKADGQLLSKGRRLMAQLEKECVEMQLVETTGEILTMDMASIQILMNTVFWSVTARETGLSVGELDARRYGMRSFLSIHDLLFRKRVRGVGALNEGETVDDGGGGGDVGAAQQVESVDNSSRRVRARV